MRTKRKPDLDDVQKQFEAWRRRRPPPPFPPELWQAACGLLDRHTAHTICETLRLNESRFKQMRVQSTRGQTMLKRRSAPP